MKRFKNWLVCQVIGHSIDPCDYWAEECFRCGLLFHYDDPPRSDLGFFLDYFNKTGLFRYRTWITGRRCECCQARLKKGQMFLCGKGKCTDEWMPF